MKQIGAIDKLKAQEIRNKIHIAQVQTVYRLIQDRSVKNIEDIEKEALSNNISANLGLKIDSDAGRQIGLYDSEQIIDEINKGNRIVTIRYSKIPNKQNLAEKCQKEYLRKRGICVKGMPQCGKKSLRIMNGEFIQGRRVGTKAVDFYLD